MPPTVSHPLFARLFARLIRLEDRSGGADLREELLAGLSGRVIEVGAGSGANFAHYPPEVTEVVAVEPEPYLRGLAVEAARECAVEVEVVDGVAEELPVADGWADAAIASLVLCSIEEPVRALREMGRVVRPEGELRFYEHVRSTDERSGRLQDGLDIVWPHLFGNCHTGRDTAATIHSAGWRIEDMRRLRIGPDRFPNPVAPHIIGRAVRA
jgi:SAM-dependent methyltransferase